MRERERERERERGRERRGEGGRGRGTTVHGGFANVIVPAAHPIAIGAIVGSKPSADRNVFDEGQPDRPISPSSLGA